MQLDQIQLTSLEKVDRWILEWNARYPIDFWWRRRHKVAFGSSQHLSISHWEMMIEFREEQLIRKWKQEAEERELDKDLVDMGHNTPERRPKMTKKQIDEAFETLDLTQFVDKPATTPKEENNLLT